MRGNVYRAGGDGYAVWRGSSMAWWTHAATEGEAPMMIKHVRAVAAVAICFAMGMPPARADDYPSRPITMVVPLAPGGSTDTLGRIIAQGMRPTLGQPVVVENTAGAAGT